MTMFSETPLVATLAIAGQGDTSGIDEAHARWNELKQLRGMTEGKTNNGSDAESFTTAYLIVVNSLTDTLHREVARACGAAVDRADSNQRNEVCAAVWTMIRVALAASLLSSTQQRVVMETLGRRLCSRWGEDVCSADGEAGPIQERAAFYLQQVDPQDPVTTSTRIVGTLLETAGVAADQREIHTRVLAGLIAHRIVSDVWLFNAWESEGKLGPAAASTD